MEYQLRLNDVALIKPMQEINPNQLKQIRRGSDGMRNTDDILEGLDLPTNREHNELPNVVESLEECEMSEEAKECLVKVRDFCAELSDRYQQEFVALIQEYQATRRRIPQDILDYMAEKKLDLPSFCIAHKNNAEKILEEFGMPSVISDRELLLIFQLPKPLAHFWRKGGADSWGSGAEDIQGAAIEWGYFYRELMRIVWETQGRNENENQLAFTRVNGIKNHDARRYYYIWKISEWGIL